MLRLTNINKTYITGTFSQKALNNVSLDFRKNEFVTILGPSGCGKTTLLNIIGGLDHYDSGDLIISGKSTKEFKDLDWDMYRNNSIGFIFQSHNLIPHLNVLQNVELGLTLSGVSASERKARAIEVLDEVGLKNHLHKRPNQLSGGESQRVAIARALANNPDVVLADEPTGSLDSVTSIQILELIKRIAQDKLVIMVTHNTELANKYANRIVRLKDGEVIDDTNPVAEVKELKGDFSLKKTSMNFMTAIVSSINNIRTKLGRTILTAFAGSIGIIGIALILSLSNGLDQEISAFERETLSGYPITITTSKIDFERMRTFNVEDLEAYPDTDYALAYDENRLTSFFLPNLITTDYIDYVDRYVKEVDPLGIIGIKYTHNMNLSLLRYDEGSSDYEQIYAQQLDETPTNPGSVFGFVSRFFTQLPEGDVLANNYDLIYGNMPANQPNEKKFQVVLVVDEYNRIYQSTLDNRLGFDTTTTTEFPFSSIVGLDFKLYIGSYDDETSDIAEAVDIEISGIVRIKESSNVSLFYNGFGYDQQLVDYILDNHPEEIGSVSGIYIYPDSFEDKEELADYLNAYNDQFSENSLSRIEYVDQAATFTSMVKGVIDTISIVLIAFAAISLVVSSIMIAIITYISVLERIKEIGVLRALGARKKDVSRVFNAENLVIGFVSGVVGIGVALLLIIPINRIIENLAEMPNVAKLSAWHSFFLIGISILLAFVAGLIPARIASNKDPVEALRTE
ncbi:MAG: ATP-binding cassette domain-containing protein [Candidatus Izemoplasmatales bacterium]|nr:ATP-binding cassette domain-containing protein [Candidatus Izemoplasmatales bacterium]